jgi:glutathione S-transferase
MIIVHAKNLAERIELVAAPVTPFSPLDLAIEINPLGKIPALLTNDGMALYGSTVIAEYLDALDGAPRFFPAGTDRWVALRRNALADGILEAGVLARVEGLRPPDRQWSDWRDVQMLKIANGLDALEREARLLASETMAIGEVAVICALGWLDFRFADMDWRVRRPDLARWFAQVSQQAAIARTAPERAQL